MEKKQSYLRNPLNLSIILNLLTIINLSFDTPNYIKHPLIVMTIVALILFMRSYHQQKNESGNSGSGVFQK